MYIDILVVVSGQGELHVATPITRPVHHLQCVQALVGRAIPAAKSKEPLRDEERTPPNDLPRKTWFNDWVFLLLPTPTPDLAIQRFRHKWLIDPGEDSKDSADAGDYGKQTTTYTEVAIDSPDLSPHNAYDVFLQIREAISALRNHSRSLVLSDDERNCLIGLVAQWAEIKEPIPNYPEPFWQYQASQPNRRASASLASIIGEINIPEEVAEGPYKKVRDLIEADTPGFRLVPGLINLMPDRFDEIMKWVRMGLLSDRDITSEDATSMLLYWFSESAKLGSPFTQPPDEFLQEIGVMIASRRMNTLPHALKVAK